MVSIAGDRHVIRGCGLWRFRLCVLPLAPPSPLVLLLGLTEGRAPRFVKRYAQLAESIRGALETYAEEVRNGSYPAPEHTYAMPEEELELFSSAAERVEHAHGDG